MGKGKTRHNPDKRQNKMGGECSYYEKYHFGLPPFCAGGKSCAEICKGNPHNCVKTFYKRAASRSNKQINEGDFRYK